MITLNIQKNILINKYLKEQKTMAQIAEDLACSGGTIKNYLNKYSIQGRRKWNLSDESKKRIGLASKGRKYSEEQKLKLRGRIASEETKNKMRIYHQNRPIEHRKNLSGENNGSWKGGLVPINAKIRHSFEYKIWRESVFKRDNFTCVFCGDDRGGNLNADHIKPFSLFPESRFDVDNGRTLCIPCHENTETFGAKLLKQRELYKSF